MLNTAINKLKTSLTLEAEQVRTAMLSVIVQWVAHLIRNQELPEPILGTEVGYPH
jgi:hypothetical protein